MAFRFLHRKTDPSRPSDLAPLADESQPESAEPLRHVAALCAGPLAGLLAVDSAVVMTMACTTAGIEITHAAKPGAPDPARLASIAGSLRALAVAASADFPIGDPDTAIIESSLGRAVFMNVHAENHDLILCIITSGDVFLGKVILSAKDSSLKIANALDETGL